MPFSDDRAAIIRVVFERLTVEARSALQRGHAEGRALGATRISSGHYLLGLVCNEVGLGAKVLRSLKLSAEEVKGCLVGDDAARPPAVGMAPVSDEAKDALRAADEFSGGGDIESDHFLLGLVTSPEGVAAQIVTQLSVEPAAIRDELTRLGGSDP
jgi:ATP-dependent Clp protease ATP-binding subunit ClpC